MGFDRGPAPNTERAPIRSGLQLGLPGRWWDDGKTAKKLGLRSDQQRRMDDIFEANKTNLANLLGNLQREETHLTSLSPSELQDEAVRCDRPRRTGARRPGKGQRAYAAADPAADGFEPGRYPEQADRRHPLAT
jgi:hypothetical protein